MTKKDQCSEDKREQAAGMDSEKALRCGQIGLIHRKERGPVWLEHQGQWRRVIGIEATVVGLPGQ